MVDQVVIVAAIGTLAAYDAETGALLLVLSEEGDLALEDATPTGFIERSRASGIEGKTWNHPVLAGDILLVRTPDEMAAFRLSGRGERRDHQARSIANAARLRSRC